MEKQMNRGLRATVLVVALAVLLGGAAFAYNALFASSKAGDVQSARTSPDTAGLGQGSALTPSHPLGGTRVGEAAADFSLSDAEGRKVSLSAIRNGKAYRCELLGHLVSVLPEGNGGLPVDVRALRRSGELRDVERGRHVGIAGFGASLRERGGLYAPDLLRSRACGQ